MIFINGKEVKCAEISQRSCIHLNLSSQNHTYNTFQMNMDGPPVYSHSESSKQQFEQCFVTVPQKNKISKKKTTQHLK